MSLGLGGANIKLTQANSTATIKRILELVYYFIRRYILKDVSCAWKIGRDDENPKKELCELDHLYIQVHRHLERLKQISIWLTRPKNSILRLKLERQLALIFDAVFGSRIWEPYRITKSNFLITFKHGSEGSWFLFGILVICHKSYEN